MIYQNTYSLLIINLKNKRVLYKHTNYQLWESPCYGFLCDYKNDFILLNKEGMSFVKLSELEMHKTIGNPDGIKRMIHSIGSANYLKIEESNMVDYQSPLGADSSQSVTIQQQYLDAFGNTYYDDIFSLNLSKMKLKELILVESIFRLDSSGEIMKIIDLQPDCQLFVKSFMELEQGNLVQIFSFDGRVTT